MEFRFFELPLLGKNERNQNNTHKKKPQTQK